jgi:phenylacetaldehyde dehydrogenase
VSRGADRSRIPCAREASNPADAGTRAWDRPASGAAPAALGEHDDVDKIAFTGSMQTGRQIAVQAAMTLKLVTFELGGKSPNIVFPDAVLEEPVRRSA